MKFGIHWKYRLSNMPKELHDSCLDYKKYKRATKTPSLIECQTILNLLMKDAQQTDFVFKQYRLQRQYAWAIQFFCMSSAIVKPLKSSPELLDFAYLNTQCLFKICKRLDKRLHTNTFLKWLGDARKNRLFTFTNHMQHICMQIESQHPPSLQECPICLESLCPSPKNSTIIVLACGHVVCKDCIMSLLGVASSKGTTYNRIAYGCHLKASRCPICRDSYAFTKYKEYPMSLLLHSKR